MSVQDVVTVCALVAAVLALPAAWQSARIAKKVDGRDEFNAHLTALQGKQLKLTRLAFDGSPQTWRSNDVPMLTKPEWISSAPFDLDEIEIGWRDGDDEFLDRARRSAARVLSPLKIDPIDRYSTALVQIAGMNKLFDGVVYRLFDVDLNGADKRMTFTRSSYFSYLDTCETLAFEAERLNAAGKRIDSRRSHRRTLGDPFDLRNRVASLGIDTLTIRVAASGDAGFFLHRRDPKDVVNNSAMLGLIPAGEFTPSDVSSEAVSNDLNLWRNIMREYAEEFLGADDAQGQGGRWLDYAADFPYRELERARASGKLQIKVLGLGIDPLPWKPELLTVCVIDAAEFDAIFVEIPRRNAEGTILMGNGRDGLPFDARTIARYCAEDTISPNAEACLRLAWRFRDQLGLG